MTTSVRVSVVIPLGNALEDLPAQLAALAPQCPDVGGEIILACNGTSPSRVEPVVSSLRQTPWVVRLLDARAARGPSYARNVGWRAAKAECVLFCDADDIVADNWVDAMLRGLRRASVVGGALEYRRLNTEPTAGRLTVQTELATRFDHLSFAPSCDLGMHRSVLTRIGGFDEDLRCGEDTDLCWRAAYAGYAIEFVPDAVVHYRLRPDVSGTFRQAFAYAVDDTLLLRMHRRHGARRRVALLIAEAFAALKNSSLAIYREPARFQAARQWGFLAGTIIGRFR